MQDPQMKILIVDDEPMNVRVLANALKGEYAICTAANGRDAITMVKAHSPDLVLLDIMMPDLDGLEVCRILRADENYADVPIVFVTAADSSESEAQGLKLGAVDYITKPVNLQLVRLRIHNQLELRRQRNLLREQYERLARSEAQLKQSEQRAQHLAMFDPLTDLPNRRMLMDRLRSGLAQAKRFGRSLAVMFLDLDRFKQVNDSFGHDAGDELLREVARRITACVREGDTLARSGGDEFIIVLPEIANPSDATRVAEKIRDALHQPVEIRGRALDVTTSIGIAVYPIDGADDALELMKKADRAMYAAKQAGRNAYRLYDASLAD